MRERSKMPGRGGRRLVPLAVLALCIAWVSASLLTRDGTPAPDSLPNRRETARLVIWTDLEGDSLDFHAKFFARGSGSTFAGHPSLAANARTRATNCSFGSG